MRACVSVSATALAIAAIAAGCGSGSANNAGTAGSGNSAGGAGTGGTGPTVCGPQAQPPAANGQNFPFPQHRLATSCGYPTNCSDNDVQIAWTTYKTQDDRRLRRRHARAAPRERQRHGVGRDRLRDDFRRVHGRQGDVRRPVELREAAPRRQGADALAHRRQRQHRRSGRGDRRRRGHGVRAHDGGQAVGRVRERREHPGGGDPQQRGVERQHPAARRQRQHGNRRQPVLLRPRLLPRCSRPTTAAG